MTRTRARRALRVELTLVEVARIARPGSAHAPPARVGSAGSWSVAVHVAVPAAIVAAAVSPLHGHGAHARAAVGAAHDGTIEVRGTTAFRPAAVIAVAAQRIAFAACFTLQARKAAHVPTVGVTRALVRRNAPVATVALDEVKTVATRPCRRARRADSAATPGAALAVGVERAGAAGRGTRGHARPAARSARRRAGTGKGACASAADRLTSAARRQPAAPANFAE